MNPVHVAGIIQMHRYRLGSEALLQEDVEARLRSAKIPFAREKVLGPADRVDFLVDGHIAVECKLRCGRKAMYRQLQRYARHDCVDALILVTLTPTGMPADLLGKPVYVVSLGRTGL